MNRSLRNAPSTHLGLKDKLLAKNISPDVFVEDGKHPAPAALAMEMEAECQATIEIKDTDEAWEAARTNWLQGKPPTNDSKWKSGVFYSVTF